jgi:hypothetical protein
MSNVIRHHVNKKYFPQKLHIMGMFYEKPRRLACILAENGLNYRKDLSKQ